MKRRALFILLLLVSGAIINVAVAWGVGHSHEFSMVVADRQLTQREMEPLWSRYVDPNKKAYVSGGMTTQLMTTQRYLGEGIRFVRSGSGLICIEPYRANAITVEVVESGFPCRSLAHATKWDKASWARMMNGAMPVPPKSIEWLGACTMLWPGFAINTVFYGAILWLLFALTGTPFALRRRRRIKRGLCPKCAYPVGTNDVCTECGAAVSPSPSEVGRGSG